MQQKNPNRGKGDDDAKERKNAQIQQLQRGNHGCCAVHREGDERENAQKEKVEGKGAQTASDVGPAQGDVQSNAKDHEKSHRGAQPIFNERRGKCTEKSEHVSHWMRNFQQHLQQDLYI